MTNKEIKKALILDMKKDKSLKQYAKDIEELNQKSFGILIKVLKKVRLNESVQVWIKNY